jgi:hypothetical protein
VGDSIAPIPHNFYIWSIILHNKVHSRVASYNTIISERFVNVSTKVCLHRTHSPEPGKTLTKPEQRTGWQRTPARDKNDGDGKISTATALGTKDRQGNRIRPERQTGQ